MGKLQEQFGPINTGTEASRLTRLAGLPYQGVEEVFSQIRRVVTGSLTDMIGFERAMDRLKGQLNVIKIQREQMGGNQSGFSFEELPNLIERIRGLNSTEQRVYAAVVADRLYDLDETIEQVGKGGYP